MKPSEAGETVSASPDSRDAEWSARLPEIPKSKGVFWPSVITGVLCSLFGLYLVFTPYQRPVRDPGPTQPPQAEPTRSTAQPTTKLGNRILRCGLVDSADSTFALALEKFRKDVQTRSSGKLQVELLTGGLIEGVQMDEKALVEAVRTGKLELGVSTTSPLTNYNHLLDVFDLPFLIRSPGQADKVMDGQVGQRLLDSLQDKNLVGLAYMEVGFRIFSSSIPLPDYASFSGKKLRVMQSVIFTRFISAIGGDAVPSPVDKIYMMGKEGYIDGADRTYPTYWDFHLYDIHRYITETHHAYSVKMVLANRDLYHSLSDQERAILRDAAQEASRFQREKQRAADKAVKTLALKEGIKIFELSAAEREKFITASKTLYEGYRKNQSEEILEQILGLAKSP